MTNMAWCPPLSHLKHTVPLQSPLQSHTLCFNHPSGTRLKHTIPSQNLLQGHTPFFNHPSGTRLKHTIPLQSILYGHGLCFNHSGGQSGLVGKWLCMNNLRKILGANRAEDYA